jgi:hypothetical protein
VKGAVEGILAATVLNALTTRDESFVTIELEADHGWTRLRFNNADTLEVREQLRVLADAVASRRSRVVDLDSVPPTTEPDLVSALERLVMLRDLNVLSDEEFQLAKNRILRSK